MEDGFIKYGKNDVVSIKYIQEVFITDGLISFTMIDYASVIKVKPEYEAEWRKRFDLND